MREALLERQLMVALAPHLVHPLPLVVAAFDGERPDRLTGVGLNLYDVMSVERLRGARRGRACAGADGADAAVARDPSEWSPERHRMISGDEVLELVPALAARAPTSGYLFYDCQTDDARLVLTVLAEAERFGAVCANRLEVTELVRDEAGRAAGVRVRDAAAAASSSCARRTSSTRPACGPTGCAPRSCTTRPRCRASARAAARTSRCATRTCRSRRAARSCPAGGGRTIFALPWLGRTLLGTTDNDYEGALDGPPRAARPRRTSTTCSTRRTSTSAPR